MPTGARVIAAICIAFVAWIVSGLVKQLLVNEPGFGNFVPLCVVIGLLCGWIILGRRADRGRLGYANAIGVGLSAMAMTVFWVLLLVSVWKSFDRAMSRVYHDPMKVVYDVYPIAWDYGQVLKDVDILVWLIFGGAIAGILAHLVGEKWPGR